MSDSVFHPDSDSLPKVMISAILKKWAVPAIEPLKDSSDYSEGFVVRDGFTGTWEVTIRKVA